MKRNSSVLVIAVLLALVMGPHLASAKTLLLDFGPTVTLAADATNSPAHYVTAVPPGEISWNTVTADTTSLVYSDGSAAAGVSLDLGRSTAGSDTIDFNDNGFTVSALGGSLKGGVYAGTSPVRDGIFGGAGGANNLAVGVRVNGLPAGTYTLYVHGRNTSTGLIASLLLYATNGPSAGTYSFTTNGATAAVSNSSPALTNSFVEGNNFGVLTVTLAAGESLYVASEGATAAETRGFLNSLEIFFGVPTLNLPAKIVSQPASKAVYEGVNVIFSPLVSGTSPITNQWHWFKTNLLSDGPAVAGARSNTLVLRAVTTEMAGDYRLAVSNAVNYDISSNATLSVTKVFNTPQMTNIWTLNAGDWPYLGAGGTERGIAYNPLTTNLLLVSRAAADPSLIVLDALTGVQKHTMEVSGIPPSVPNVSLGLNAVAVADDGVVFGVSVTTAASSTPLCIYGWQADGPFNPSGLLFAGDPAAAVQPNLRWGDNLAVRGSGAGTQILLAPATGTNVVLLRSLSGQNFQYEIPPAVIAVNGVTSGFARFSIVFGPGTNTFWAKTSGGALYLVEFDLNTGVGNVVQSYPNVVVPTAIRAVGVDKNQKFLAGLMAESLGDNVRLYDISDLALGPLYRDQEVFATQNAASSGGASVACGDHLFFVLNENNGIKAFALNTNYVAPKVTIVANPAGASVMAGATVSFNALAAGNDPLTLRWLFNGTNVLVDGPNVSGATGSLLTLRNVTTNQAGGYSLQASNLFGQAVSSNAVLSVVPAFNTAQATNIWNLLPGDRSYLSATNSSERGMAYNPLTTNLLLVSRAVADPALVVLDALTGAEKRFMDVSGLPVTVPGVSLGLNQVAVADDGAVYGASVTVNASTTSFLVYRWPNDGSASAPAFVFLGDPEQTGQPGQRWGDTIAVRGAGADTQILLSPGSGTNVVLLRTTSGLDFQYEVPPSVIAVSGVPSGFARLGLAFGPGPNTFWAKVVDGPLYLVGFDLASNTGSVLREFSTNAVSSSLRGISTGFNQRFLAGIALELSHNVQLYEVPDLASGPVLRDQEVFATLNPNVTVGGVGVTAFGGNYLFALDCNNGLKAFMINPDYRAPLTQFPIVHISPIGGSVVFSWKSVPGHTYQVRSRETLSSGSWDPLGASILATGTTTSFTNTLPGTTRFYRVQGE